MSKLSVVSISDWLKGLPSVYKSANSIGNLTGLPKYIARDKGQDRVVNLQELIWNMEDPDNGIYVSDDQLVANFHVMNSYTGEVKTSTKVGDEEFPNTPFEKIDVVSWVGNDGARYTYLMVRGLTSVTLNGGNLVSQDPVGAQIGLVYGTRNNDGTKFLKTWGTTASAEPINTLYGEIVRINRQRMNQVPQSKILEQVEAACTKFLSNKEINQTNGVKYVKYLVENGLFTVLIANAVNHFRASSTGNETYFTPARIRNKDNSLNGILSAFELAASNGIDLLPTPRKSGNVGEALASVLSDAIPARPKRARATAV